MTDIWFFDWRGTDGLVQASVELMDDFAGWGDISPYRTRSYSFNYHGHHYPHYKWGEDMWRTREEALHHRQAELIESVKAAVQALSRFEQTYTWEDANEE